MTKKKNNPAFILNFLYWSSIRKINNAKYLFVIEMETSFVYLNCNLLKILQKYHLIKEQ